MISLPFLFSLLPLAIDCPCFPSLPILLYTFNCGPLKLLQRRDCQTVPGFVAVSQSRLQLSWLYLNFSNYNLLGCPLIKQLWLYLQAELVTPLVTQYTYKSFRRASLNVYDIGVTCAVWCLCPNQTCDSLWDGVALLMRENIDHTMRKLVKETPQGSATSRFQWSVQLHQNQMISFLCKPLDEMRKSYLETKKRLQKGDAIALVLLDVWYHSWVFI